MGFLGVCRSSGSAVLEWLLIGESAGGTVLTGLAGESKSLEPDESFVRFFLRKPRPGIEPARGELADGLIFVNPSAKHWNSCCGSLTIGPQEEVRRGRPEARLSQMRSGWLGPKGRSGQCA